ncbi:unnamed protein product, partial [Closterium sp. NIES-53]
AFVGTQNVSSSSSPGDSSPPLSGMERDEAWRVTVRIQQCDMRRGYLCGSMEALNVPSTDTSVVTFWDGEIVDGKNYSFFTGQWDATRETDIKHWSRFPCFSQLKEAALKDGARSIDLSTFPYIFMRWKEKFFVNVGPDCGLTIAGFYYVCFNREDGSVTGYYYDPSS